MDVKPLDLGLELRQRVEFLLDLAPVVLGLPVARELLQQRKLHALRLVLDELLARPARLRNATAQLGELLLWHLDVEGTDVDGGIDSRTHKASMVGMGRVRRPPLRLGTSPTLLM